MRKVTLTSRRNQLRLCGRQFENAYCGLSLPFGSTHYFQNKGMKTIIALFFLLVAVQQIAAQMSDGTHASIPAKDAKNHIGEEMVVSGTISEIYVNRQTTNVYLYLDGDIDHAKFAAVWPGTNDPPVKALKNLLLKGDPTEPISVSGKIITEKHVPEIIVSSWAQIN
jgi:hypothetical protein